MKVLVLAHATYADPPTRKVFDHVAAQGIEVLLAMPRRIKHPFGPAIVPPTPWETPVRLQLLDTWYLHENGTHVVMKGIPELVHDFQPNVVHCAMEPWSLTCLQVLACMRQHSAANIYFGVQACETKPEQGAILPRFIRKQLYARVLRSASYFLGWSDLVVSVARRYGPSRLIYATAPAVGVDPDLFRPALPNEKRILRNQLPVGEQDYLVGFVGRFTEEKGVLDLVRAMDIATLSRTGQALLLLGRGPLESRLRALVSTRPWLKLLPPTDLHGVADFLRMLDTLVVPSYSTSRWEEQFGLVIAEGLSTGVHIIGSSSGSIPELLGPMADIVPERDPESLASSILKHHSRTDMMDSSSVQARHRAFTRYSHIAAANVLVETWRRAVSGMPGSTS
jgi:glycosyltransferase involved in cell wall biosynthesis